MGDLLDLVMRDMPGSLLAPFRPAVHFPPLPTFLLHPFHLPTPTASGNMVASYNPQHGDLSAPNEAAMASQVTPAAMCPSAGHCFYIAGICALERWRRFRRMQWEEQQASADGAPPSSDTWTSASIAQERKVDHTAQAIDALTRAHEVFKRQRHHRFSLFVASKIAFAYVEAERYELALRFLERIVRTYEHEAWSGPFVSQSLLSLASTEQTGDVEREGRILWSLLGAQELLTKRQREVALQQTRMWISSKALEESRRPLRIRFEERFGPLFVECVFSKSIIDLDGHRIPFQLRISSKPRHSLEGISFDELQIHLGEDAPSLRINGEEVEADEPHSKIVGLQNADFRIAGGESVDVGSTNLSWSTATLKAFQGSLIPSRLGHLQVTGVTLKKSGQASFCLDVNVSQAEEGASAVQPSWLVSAQPQRFILLPHREHPDGVFVRRRRHEIRVELIHDDHAYLDESFPVRVKITNDDPIALDCKLNVHLLATSGDTGHDRVRATKQDEVLPLSNALRDCNIGRIEPNASAEQILLLDFKRYLFPRSVEVVVQSAEPGDEKDAPEGDAPESESIATAEIPVQQLFSSSFSAHWQLFRVSDSQQKPSLTWPTFVDREGGGPGYVEISTEELHSQAVGADGAANVAAVANLNASLSVHALEEVTFEQVRIRLDEGSKHLRLLHSSGMPDGSKEENCAFETVCGLWTNGDRWGGVYDIAVVGESFGGTANEEEDEEFRTTGYLEVDWRRSARSETSIASDAQSILNTARIQLPILLPPYLLPRLVVSVSASASSQQPLVMLVTIVNPSHHPSDVLIALDDNHSDFAVLSHKSFTVPNLLSRSTRSIPLHVAARAHAGVADDSTPLVRALPRVRAWRRDRRQQARQSQQLERDVSTSVTDGGGSTFATTSTTAREEELPSIVNQRPGVGIPLDVTLRYTSSKSSAGSGGSTASAAPSSGASTADAGSAQNHDDRREGQGQGGGVSTLR